MIPTPEELTEGTRNYAGCGLFFRISSSIDWLNYAADKWKQLKLQTSISTTPQSFKR